MDTGTFRGIITGLLIIAFIGITWWAYSKRRKRDFDEAAHLIFNEDDERPNRDRSVSPSNESREAASGQDDSRTSKGDKNT
ncbi:cbb3-type cytochrome c oxidase subunit 3 [Halomonas campisalis]|uniref:Cbb3-type cytochrome c oxidase subunit 3 n=1 Tax=Billgrantia campisalis TaxID=74661 RepID=A0ABS9P993_9GAMM|nr:cbb3-type cytochrome c oxidase subunit 3 [Halomonas campisalis]MCG6657660.1 cbb3-type cytochrome c oxidase subunit 3 [Halomonas campisalis]MDR5862568.1 cbb3-type cytochrome c oxidase subunit 3 [Halomonas campisalis]